MALRQQQFGMIFASQGAAGFEKVGVAKLLGLCRWPKGPKKYSPGLNGTKIRRKRPANRIYQN
jgi:hypothetical protein